MEIIYFKEIDSTQKYLLNNLKDGRVVWSEKQNAGIGSRGNSWIGEEGNLFFSFSILKSRLPDDLPPQSISIYFMYQLKLYLSKLNSKVLFKWPNDLYLNGGKVGGAISTLKDKFVVVGIGLNTKQSSQFQKLDIDVNNKNLLLGYFDFITPFKKWKEIFQLYQIDFAKYPFYKDAKLYSDGSIEIDRKRRYGLR